MPENNTISDNLNSDNAKLNSSLPYETQLTKAFDKLTSQIFIFLLAYVILLIGIAVLGTEITNILRNLLYIIPILGVGAYVWLQQRKFTEKTEGKRTNIKNSAINVNTNIVEDSANIAGVRYPSSEHDNVNVSVNRASGKARVSGVESGTFHEFNGDSSETRYLLDIFNKLDNSRKREVIKMAQHQIDKQEEAT